MKLYQLAGLIALLFVAAFTVAQSQTTVGDAEKTMDADPSASQPANALGVHEARLRAKLLHETIHGALQVMHRDFFRDGDQRLPIPSESLEDVFEELDKSWQVKIKWLAVSAPAMNPTNLPQTPFDEAAVKAITDGASGYEQIAADTFHYAGQVTLSNQCLKCHVPQRRSLEDRQAAVVISMPLRLVERTGDEATE